MKNAMKKLMSLLLVAVLLVSAVPFVASATSGITIDFTIKDTNDTILVQESINETSGPFSVGQYFNVRGDATKYTPVKYWIKNADTGDGGQEVTADHLVQQDSKVVIKVQRNPVTLNMDIYFDGAYTKTVTKSATIGSTIILNDALAAEAGYGSYNTDVRTANLAEGQSFTVGESNPNIQIFVVSGNNNSSSNGSSDSVTTTKQPITLNIKNVEGGDVVWTDSRVPNGDTAVVSDMLKYWFNKNWSDSHNCTKVYSKEQGTIDLGTAVNPGDTVTVVLTVKNTTTTTPTNPTTATPIKIVVKVESSNNVVWSGEKVPANGKNAVVEDLLTFCWNKSWDDVYKFEHAWSSAQQSKVARTATVNAGDTVSFMLSEKNGTGNNNTNKDTYTVRFYLDAKNSGIYTAYVPVGSTVSADEVANAAYRVSTDSGYTFAGWRKNGTGDTLTTNNVTQVAITGDTYFTPVFNKNVSNKFPYPVYLNIYKDTMVGSPDKRVEITSGIALDGIVSLSEVKTVVANYYNAKNSYGIGFDGLYLAKGNWVSDYINDSNKYNTINADELRQTGTVYINVMISNAVAKTSSTADSSNPKTGDEIYMAVTALGLSGAALASALYVFTKKRTAK